MNAGFLQEQDGSRSMRRLLALYYSLLSGALFVIAALHGTTAGVYGGLGCAMVVLVLLGLTTISDIKNAGTLMSATSAAGAIMRADNVAEESIAPKDERRDE